MLVLRFRPRKESEVAKPTSSSIFARESVKTIGHRRRLDTDCFGFLHYFSIDLLI